MKESILIAAEIYFLAFVIGISIAALIKGMTTAINRITIKKEEITKGHKDKESEASA